MGYSPKHSPARVRRSTWRVRGVIVAAMTGFAALGALSFGGVSLAATTVSATTTLHARPDSGYNGNWANDSLIRKASVTLAGPDSTLTDCGATATACYTYTGTIADTGTAYAITGAISPGSQAVKITGTPSAAVAGGTNVDFHASSNAPDGSLVPSSWNGGGGVSTTDWVEQFFPAGTTFGTGPALPNWSWTYKDTKDCQQWVDAYNVTQANSGDITGVSQCPPPVPVTGEVSTFVNHSGSCIDNTGNKLTAGNPIQIWKCLNDNAQQFRLTTAGGHTVLQTGTGNMCVTATLTKGDQLTVQNCTGTGGQIVKKQGSFYEFPTQNLVMDLKAFNTSNGTKVEGWTLNGGTNQKWSLP